MENALLVVDVINGFAKEGSNKNMYCGNSAGIIGRLEKLTESAVKKGVPLIYCTDAHIETDKELKRNGGPWDYHCMADTEESEILDSLPQNGMITVKRNQKLDYKLGDASGILRIDKGAYSAFYNTDLDGILKDFGVKNVYIAGLVTGICVKHTAADAFFRGYNLKIVEDCTADVTLEGHKNAINYMKNNYSAEIITSGNAMEGL